MRMSVGRLCLALSAALLLSGCGDTVRRARESQRHWVPKGSGQDTGEVSNVDLSGLTLPGMVDWAFTNRPSMVTAQLQVEDARLALRQLDSSAPVLSSSPLGALSSSANIGRSESSNPGRHLDGDTHGGGSGALSLNVLVWDSGRYSAEAQAQAEAVLAAELDAINTGYSIFQEVVEAYFGLMEAEALLEVAFTNAAEYADHLVRAESRFEAGEAMNLDLLKARLDLAQARENIVSASNAVDVAGADLMAALGVDAAQGDFRQVLGERKGSLDAVETAFGDTSEDAAALFAFACTNAPAMQIARAKLRAASARVDYAIADLGPSISASLSLNWTDPFWYWRWGVNAVQDLFTGFRKTTAVERARNAMDQAASYVDLIEQSLSHSLEVAVAERDNAKEAFATAETSVRQAKENLDNVAAQYSVGEANRVDFTGAVAGYTAALGNRIKAACRGQVAQAKLFSMTGTRPLYREGVGNEE